MNRRAWWWTGGGAVAVLVVVGVVVAQGGTGTTGTAPPSVSLSSSPTSTTTPEPTTTAPAPVPTSSAVATLAPQVQQDLASALAVEPGSTHLDPVPEHVTSDTGQGVQVVIGTVTKIDGKGNGPGETSGPALLIPVTITNSGTQKVDLTSVVVNLYGTLGYPGTALTGDGRNVRFSGTLGAGLKATASYVLTVPQQGGPSYIATVSVEPQLPVVVAVITPKAG